jgi:signal peptidase I
MLLSQKPNKRKESLDFLLTFLFSLLAAVLALRLITAYLFMPVQVVGNSMKQTLHHGDVLIVSRLNKPNRGEVVVIEKEDGELLIKRVVGVAGDRIWTQNGVLYRERQQGAIRVVEEVAEPYLSAYNSANTWQDAHNKTDVAPVTVPKDCVYVLGDNRRDSLDSRLYGSFSAISVLGVVPQFFIDHPKLLTFLK